MSLREFREEFNGDMQAVLLGGKESVIAQLLAGSQASAPKTGGRPTKKGAMGAPPTANEPPSTGRSTRKRAATEAPKFTEQPQTEGGRAKRGRTGVCVCVCVCASEPHTVCERVCVYLWACVLGV
jgi:hypothetical protein